MTSPKATLLTRTNTLKDAAAEDLLTDAQQQAFDEIQAHREDGAHFINLHGPRYAGKTFLCWVLHQTPAWVYYQAMHDNPDTPTVIFDHGDPKRRATRKLRNHTSIHGLATILYVTRRPADELYPRVELNPDDRHYDQVASNWDTLGLDTTNAPTPIQR